jgi:hypothetical protein
VFAPSYEGISSFLHSVGMGLSPLQPIAVEEASGWGSAPSLLMSVP